MRPSSRLPRESAPNALSQALDALRRDGTSYVDLTESNPTRVGIAYPDDLLSPLSLPAALRYEPHPLGLATAREAVAADCGRRGARVDPAHVVLSASTSEMYAWLFKLLCDAGESVLVPRPSYPLFEHLTRLEGVRAEAYRLEYHGRWEIDLASVAAAPPAPRAVLLVSPNNPTGSYVSAREIDALVGLCRDRGWALIVDEVFADYTLDAAAPIAPITDLAARADVLTFSMGGASKSLGLPQVKLGWTVVGGPAGDREAALEGLELIADTFLSVSTPVQVAAASLLQRGSAVRSAIHARVRANLAAARRIASSHPSCDLLPVEGGWSAVVRIPATRGEEALVLDLLARERILVHPGYFFDFEHEAFLVVSLLVAEPAFADAFERTLRFAEAA
jgi:aspartate/methionine/tyrosine aminotransferase